MARVMVLGASGMLGAMVDRVFRSAGHDVVAVKRGDGGFDAGTRDGIEALRRLGPMRSIINCVAVTRPPPIGADTLQSLVEINGLLPWRLSAVAADLGAALIHISTDGVFRGSAEPLFEDSPCDADDPYGLSKRLGEPTDRNALSIRCSIVGPELAPRGHLLEWLLGQPDGAAVEGHIDRVWSGVTTLQLARFCLTLVEGDRFERLRARFPVVHFAPNAPLSKYELLESAVRAYGRAIAVRPVASGRPVTRVLQSRSVELIGAHSAIPFSEALAELRAAGPLHPTIKETS